MKNKKVFFQLCIMMFMQFFILAVWWVPFAAYLNALHLEIFQISLIMSSMAIGSIAAPLLGVIADRYVSSEKLLTGLNIMVAVFLFLATRQTHFAGLMITVSLAMLCYMPTWSLTSSIAMTHVSSEQFPRIRLLGTIGWVASGVFSVVAIKVFHVQKFDGTVLPLFCGVGAAFVAAVLNLFLPKTPPTADKSAKYSIQDILGLKVLSTVRSRSFNIFILISFLATIPFTLFYLYSSQFLHDKGFEYITVTNNWGQVGELFFLFITTSILIKYGIKKALLFGLSAMLLRYIALYSGVVFDQQWLYYIGILTHGLIFGLFYVAGQVYTDKAVPQEYKAQAQGFLSFIVWGLGIFAGNLLSGWMIEKFRIGEKCDWGLLFLISTISIIVLIGLFVALFKPAEKLKR